MSRRLAHLLLVVFALALVGGACVVRTHHPHRRPIVVEEHEHGKHKRKHVKHVKKHRKHHEKHHH